MFKLIAATSIALATTAASSYAVESRVSDATRATVQDPDTSRMDAYAYNIWFCAAVRRGYTGYNARMYFGTSEPFPQGSGQGQQARANALQQALHSCGGLNSCVSDCYVKRFDIQ